MQCTRKRLIILLSGSKRGNNGCNDIHARYFWKKHLSAFLTIGSIYPRVPDRKHHAFYWSEHQILIFALTAARQINCLGNVIILKRIRETDRFSPGVGKDRLQMRGEMLIGWVIWPQAENPFRRQMLLQFGKADRSVKPFITRCQMKIRRMININQNGIKASSYYRRIKSCIPGRSGKNISTDELASGIFN